MLRCWVFALLLAACSDDATHDPSPDAAIPAATCKAAAGGGTLSVSKPVLTLVYKDRWHEGWLASPAVADLDGDGSNEVIAAREGVLLAWRADGTLHFRQEVSGRIWASPVVADIASNHPGLEVAIAARGKIHVFDATGQPLAGFPVRFSPPARASTRRSGLPTWLPGDVQSAQVSATRSSRATHEMKSCGSWSTPVVAWLTRATIPACQKPGFGIASSTSLASTR